mgnify:CR=1 FL=1
MSHSIHSGSNKLTSYCSRLVFILCLLVHSPVLFSQAATEQTSQENEALASERLESLITTLENETTRSELIADLETLLAARNDEQDDSLLEALNLQQAGNFVFTRYNELFDRMGISSNAIGKFLALALAALLLTVLALFNRFLARFFDRRLKGLRKALCLSKTRFRSCFKFQVLAGYLLAGALFLYSAFLAFLAPETAQNSLSFQSIIQYLVFILFIFFVFIFIYELVNASMEYIFSHNENVTDARVNTLLPILRNVLYFALFAISALVILSELGVDIVPLMAGAGVVGIAIGFGAQTLVKDYLNGFIVIFEDLLQVGDIVELAGRLGEVEKITIRRVQLRSLDGIVHTIPFSDINIVDNYTKEFSYYLLDIGVAYRENTDEVIDCLRKIDEEIRQDENYANDILDSMDIFGVDKFADSAVVIRARIKTVAHKRWRVGREYNRRIKMAFDKQGIEIPFPHQTLYFGEDKDGSAPAGNIKLSKHGAVSESPTNQVHKKANKEPIKKSDTR